MTLPPQADSESGGSRTRTIPEASVTRLALYLRTLGELGEQGVETVSSEELAAVSGVNPAKLRKDLSYIGSYGIRGVGYDVSSLLGELERVLGLNHRQSVALIGVGNLGHALAGYSGFGGRGFPITALFDVDPDLVGIHINGILVEHVREIPRVCREREVTIGVLATPAQAAQAACDQLVEAGVRCILNFAPAVLQVPAEVEVRKVDLAVELQVLAFHVAQKNLAQQDLAQQDPAQQNIPAQQDPARRNGVRRNGSGPAAEVLDGGAPADAGRAHGAEHSGKVAGVRPVNGHSVDGYGVDGSAVRRVGGGSR